MKIAYIRWKDACAEESDGPMSEQRLAELHEVGFFIGETEDAVTIVMEHQDHVVHPGRWRLHIPKNNILEMRVVDFKKAFAPPRPPRKKKKQEQNSNPEVVT